MHNLTAGVFCTQLCTEHLVSFLACFVPSCALNTWHTFSLPLHGLRIQLAHAWVGLNGICDSLITYFPWPFQNQQHQLAKYTFLGSLLSRPALVFYFITTMALSLVCKYKLVSPSNGMPWSYSLMILNDTSLLKELMQVQCFITLSYILHNKVMKNIEWRRRCIER